MTTRRNLLTMLGLTAATSAAIGADDVTNQRDCAFEYGAKGKRLQTAKYAPERLAAALERLAAEVRSCDVNISRFNISADAVGSNHWLTQTLTIDVEFLVDNPNEV